MNRYLAFLCFLFINTTLFAQSGGVKGFVYDKQTGEPIIFTNVYLEGTTIGSATDINGYFAITSIPEGTYNMLCSYLGYDSSSTSITIVKDRVTTQNIYLKESSLVMDIVQIDGAKQKAQNSVQISSLKISTEAIKQVPSIGGEADIAQYLQVVPGVVFSGEQGGQLYIRGGAPIQNKILLDGMTIYNPFHSMGVFSVFETDIIKNVDILTGGFNSQYGGRLSAIVDINTKDGSKNRLKGKASVNPFVAKAIIEGPIAKFDEKTGTSSSYILTAKNSLIDASGQQLYSGLIDSLPYNFTDVYGKFSVNGKNGSRINLFGFNFNDGVNYQSSSLGWTTYGLGMNYSIVPPNSTMKIDGSLTYSDYKTELSTDNQITRASNINGFGFNMQFTYYMENDEEIRYGFDVTGESMDYNFLNPYNVTLNIDNKTTDLAAYAKYKMRKGKSIIDYGVRIQQYGKLQTTTFEPRIGYKLNANDNLRFKFAGGLYSQSLIAAVSEREVINLFSGFLFAPQETLLDIDGNNARHLLQKAWHAIGGFEKDLGNNVTMNFEGYYKLYTQLININRNKTQSSDPDYMIEEGDAYGLDLLIKYNKKGFNIWGTYSLSFVQRNDGEQVYFTTFDRRHNSNIVSSYSFGSNRDWEISAKWNIGSGFPFTQIVNYHNDIDFGGSGVNTDYVTGQNSIGISYGTLNGGRLPYFHRLDMSIKKTFVTGKEANGRLETVLSLTNAYNRANVFYYNHLTNETVRQLPLIPSLGMNWSF